MGTSFSERCLLLQRPKSYPPGPLTTNSLQNLPAPPAAGGFRPRLPRRCHGRRFRDTARHTNRREPRQKAERMRIDWYAKSVLTVIAVLLGVVVLRDLPAGGAHAAEAQAVALAQAREARPGGSPAEAPPIDLPAQRSPWQFAIGLGGFGMYNTVTDEIWIYDFAQHKNPRINTFAEAKLLGTWAQNTVTKEFGVVSLMKREHWDPASTQPALQPPPPAQQRPQRR